MTMFRPEAPARHDFRPRIRPARPPRPPVLALACLAASCLAPAAAGAQVFEAVGARALGMGGAFVAVADDGTATYWNPAGLGTGVVVEACAGYGRGERWEEAGGAAAGQSHRAATFCLATPVIAFSVNRLAVNGGTGASNSTAGGPASRQDLRPQGVGVSSLTTTQYGLTLVQTVVPGVTVGGTLKLVTARAGAGEPAAGTPEAVRGAAEALRVDAGTTADADVGVMAGGGSWRAGLTIRNLRRPAFDTAGGGRLGLSRQARLGIAWTPGGDAAGVRSDPRGLIVALDADLTRTAAPGGDRRNVAAGVERWWWGRRLGLRAGARASTVGDARPVAAAGASLGVTRGVFLEAAASGGRAGGDRGWFVGIRAGL